MKTFLAIFSAVVFLALCHSSFAEEDGSFFTKTDDELKLEDSDFTCPNNRTKCKPTQTCCKTKHNSYHCCRYKHAVCCSDRFHCCPHGSTCDLKRKRCNKDNVDDLLSSRPLEEPMEWKVETDEIKETNPIGKEVKCPNNKTTCKDTKTCCITKHGNYYCCPHKNAVCCSDKWSCCPEDTTCDLKNKKCTKSTTTKDSLKSSSQLEPAIKGPVVVENLNLESFAVFLFKIGHKTICPNHTFCPGHQTCCRLANSNYGCCPLTSATCCPDMATCCPHNTRCLNGGCV